MSGKMLLIVLLAAACASYCLTPALARLLRRLGILDHPNERSLHQAPIPRGGGLIVVAVVQIVHAALIVFELVDASIGVAWWIAASALAFLGWCDDMKPRAAALRLTVQLVVAVVVVVSLAPVAAGDHGFARVMAEIGGTTIAIVWAVNLFNFMDGADGFAATQTILATTAGTFGLLYLGHLAPAVIALALAGAALGFLRWNWYPAKIFLGDCGSYFIGFQFAALALFGGADYAHGLFWLTLMMPFVVDATLTLLARAVRGRRVWRSHREHAFQLLVLNGWRPPTLVFALIALNALVCWPFAFVGLWHAQLALPACLGAATINAWCWLLVRRRWPSPVRSRSA